MKLPISPRLLACCAYVTPGDRVADIGCDHGYLGIHLIQSGICPETIEADIRPGPLQAAIRNGEAYGLTHKIRFFLSDGVQSIPRDFDTLVCAGMGADVMVSILSAAPWLQSTAYRLVLQCQSKAPTLRRYLADTGWHIRREQVLRDGRFFYTVMDCVWAPGHPLTPGQCYLSPALLESGSELLPEYINWVRDHLSLQVAHQEQAAGSFEAAALKELEAL